MGLKVVQCTNVCPANEAVKDRWPEAQYGSVMPLLHTEIRWRGLVRYIITPKKRWAKPTVGEVTLRSLPVVSGR